MPETPRGEWAPERLRAVAAGIEREFPLTSRRTLLSLFDLDPDQLQAQWQVESGQLALVRGAFPVGLEGVHQRLRLLREDAGRLEVAALSLPAGELDAQGVARFLVSGGPGVVYRAELGLATPEGGWILLARSNLATLPPRPLRVISPRPVEFFGDQEETGARLPPLATLPAGEEFSPPWDPTLADAGQELEPEFPQPIGVTPSLGTVSQPTGAPRSRPTSGRASQPLVIARTPPPGQDQSPAARIAAPLSPLAPAQGYEALPASAGQTCPLLPPASPGQTSPLLLPTGPGQTSPLLATFDPRGTRSSPGSGSTSFVDGPSGAWEDSGGQGLGVRCWLFAYSSDTPSAAGLTPRPLAPGPSPRP